MRSWPSHMHKDTGVAGASCLSRGLVDDVTNAIGHRALWILVEKGSRERSCGSKIAARPKRRDPQEGRLGGERGVETLLLVVVENAQGAARIVRSNRLMREVERG